MTDPQSPPPIPRPRPRPRDHVTTPPAQNGGRTNGAFQGAPNGNARSVVEHSVYNWVELVYRAFGLEVPTDPRKVALLGVRESTFADGAGADPAAMVLRERAAAGAVGETAAVTGVQDLAAVARAEDRFTRDAAGNAQTDKSNSIVRFNDLLYMVWSEQGPTIDQHVEVFRCTIDPGANESDTAGTPLLLEGYPYKAKPTNHKGVAGALQVYSGAAPNVRLAREATKTRNVFTNARDAMIAAHDGNGSRPWLFVADEANTSIHIHWSRDYGDAGVVKNWSTGCTVLAHAPGSPRYATDFRARWEAAPNLQEIPYLVVSSKYVVLYDDWQAELRRNPGTRPTTRSVIKDEGIPIMARAPSPPASHPGAMTPERLVPLAGRLPSIATAGFVQEVEAAITALAAGTYASAPRGANQAALAANLRESLTKLGVTTLTA